jgi:hypothetical protein
MRSNRSRGSPMSRRIAGGLTCWSPRRCPPPSCGWSAAGTHPGSRGPTASVPAVGRLAATRMGMRASFAQGGAAAQPRTTDTVVRTATRRRVPLGCLTGGSR